MDTIEIFRPITTALQDGQPASDGSMVVTLQDVWFDKQGKPFNQIRVVKKEVWVLAKDL